MLKIELPGWKGGRAQRIFMDAVTEDMQMVSVTEEGARDRVRDRGR